MISLQGIHVDEIVSLGSSCKLRFDDDDFVADAEGNNLHVGEWTATHHWHEEALQLASNGCAKVYVQEPFLKEAFWRTLIWRPNSDKSSSNGYTWMGLLAMGRAPQTHETFLLK
jgi:hypothetical protein